MEDVLVDGEVWVDDIILWDEADEIAEFVCSVQISAIESSMLGENLLGQVLLYSIENQAARCR